MTFDDYMKKVYDVPSRASNKISLSPPIAAKKALLAASIATLVRGNAAYYVKE